MSAPHQLSRKTLCWVSAAHVLVLVLALLVAHIVAPTPAPPKLLLVNLGQPDHTNPADGEASALSRGPAVQAPPQSPAAPPPPVTPQPPPAAPPVPVEPPSAPARDDFPTAPPPVKPKPAKPKPTQVKVDLTKPVTRSAKPPGVASTNASSTVSGRAAGRIERSLSSAISGHPAAGVPGGSKTGTDGSPGSPDGHPNGDWYRTLIKNTLERHWLKPSADNPNLTTTIKIKILADGAIQYLGMTGSSGDTAMDRSVIDAVRAAGRMSMPPPAGFPKPYEDTVIFRLKSD
ncbi:MAG: TonB C-terminal domain-containing protein [Verrucomicrobiales bacterium]|jgi:TonB family protein|nr:TonB C-terminal domain-containing protein [Verrucomicrobiales bacterium]